MVTRLYSHPIYLEHLTPPGHPERPDRLRVIERVLTQFQAIPKDDLDYLLDKLDYYSEMAAREDALEDTDAA